MMIKFIYIYYIFIDDNIYRIDIEFEIFIKLHNVLECIGIKAQNSNIIKIESIFKYNQYIFRNFYSVYSFLLLSRLFK